uniref:protein-tyrosine-phosphatase n=1 Tax=Saccoglossus kowalevskii TaxID=10224 RepID=A0ABM0LY21_SACKO|nr:PREDICTED: uncharacterized protein LOC102804874 [Saccoglossus kowalevskii]
MDHQERILLFLTVSVVILSSSFAANCQLGYDERVFAVYNDKISCESAGHCWDDDVTSEIPSCYYDGKYRYRLNTGYCWEDDVTSEIPSCYYDGEYRYRLNTGYCWEDDYRYRVNTGYCWDDDVTSEIPSYYYDCKYRYRVNTGYCWDDDVTSEIPSRYYDDKYIYRVNTGYYWDGDVTSGIPLCYYDDKYRYRDDDVTSEIPSCYYDDKYRYRVNTGYYWNGDVTSGIPLCYYDDKYRYRVNTGYYWDDDVTSEIPSFYYYGKYRYRVNTGYCWDDDVTSEIPSFYYYDEYRYRVNTGYCWDDDVTSEIPSCYYDGKYRYRVNTGYCWDDDVTSEIPSCYYYGKYRYRVNTGYCWDDDVTSEMLSCYYYDSCNDGHFRGSLGQCIPCHCKVQCHKKTGVCMSGCVDGYTGDNCQTKQAAPPDQPDEMEIVAAVVVIIVMIVIFSIATAYVVRGRRCPAWNKDPNPATRMTTQHETNPCTFLDERRRRPEDLYWSNENTPRTQLRNINHGTPRQSPRPPVAAAADEFQRNHMTSSTDEHPSTSNEVAVVASTEIDSTHDTSRYERSNQSVDKPALLNDEQGTNGDDDELPQVDDEVVPSAMPQRPANNDDKTTDVKDEHQTVEHVGEPELPVIQSDEHQTVTPVSEPELPAIQSDEHQTVVHVSEPGPTVIQSDEHQTVAQVGEPGPTVIQSTCVHTTEEPAQLSAGEPCKSERTEPQPPPETLVKICDLPKYVQEKRLTDSLREQYKSFPAEPAAACTTGVLAANKPKNRFKNIIAYDHSRVVLEKLEDDPNSDYINANYIDGYKKPKAYIATQGPKKETSHDFWRMVWQEKSRTILMATNVVELGKVKCYKYWPKMSAGETFYGGLSVINLHEDTYPDSVVRTFRLKKNDGGEVRKVKHFHFTAWPDKTVPMYPSAVLTFLSRVKSFNPPNSGPIIVNCSAGVGRTGTFITIDSMLEMAEAEGQVDIYNFVKNSRKDRTYFVQVFDQYDFIHTAILISTVCGITETTKNGFKSKIEVLKMKDANTGLTGFQQEYKNLEIVCPIPTEKQMKAAVSDENVKKNRYKDSSTLPLDFYRPRLMTRIDDEQSTDYINASFVTVSQ